MRGFVGFSTSRRRDIGRIGSEGGVHRVVDVKVEGLGGGTCRTISPSAMNVTTKKHTVRKPCAMQNRGSDRSFAGLGGSLRLVAGGGCARDGCKEGGSQIRVGGRR